MFGLTFDKLIVVGVIAAFLVGPSRLPGYAAKLGELVRRLRSTADGLKERVADEIGQDIDWQKLDPRHYDPRAIVRDALFDDEQEAPAARSSEPD